MERCCLWALNQITTRDFSKQWITNEWGIKNKIKNLPSIVVIQHINTFSYGAAVLAAMIKLEYHSVCIITLTGTLWVWMKKSHNLLQPVHFAAAHAVSAQSPYKYPRWCQLWAGPAVRSSQRRHSIHTLSHQVTPSCPGKKLFAQTHTNGMRAHMHEHTS